MSVYRVIRKTDQAQVYEYGSEVGPIEWVGFEFATHDHIEVAEAPPPEHPGPWTITKLAFRGRFTATEKAGITYAAKQNTPQAAGLQAYLDDVQAATFVDLKRPDTRAGVQALESYGLLAAGRAAAILDTPPVNEEVYRA